jgi:4-amino-4-deoxy-L-arabinose transferase-like glycosyltransferase
MDRIGGGLSSISAAARSFARHAAPIVLLIGLGVAVFARGMSRAPLLDWDEATYAQVAHEMVASARYIEYSWNGAPYLKKPPMLFWAMAASFKTLGESEFSARLPSVICAILTMLLLYASGCLAGGAIAGIFAATIPLGFYFFVARGGRECATDPLLVMFSTLAVYAMLKGLQSRRWLLVSGIALGLAIMSKGAAGVVPMLAIAIAALTLPQFSRVGWRGMALMLGACAAVAAPWYAYEAIHNPLFWDSFISHETIHRLARHLEDETQPAAYTVMVFLKETYWLAPLLIPLALIAAASIRAGLWRSLRRVHPAVALWLLWMAIALGAACAVQTKLGWYVLPALIPAALLAGAILGAAFSSPARRTALFAGGAIAVALMLAQVPGRIRMISTTIAMQRAHSLPSRALGLKARTVAQAQGPGQLYFGGVELPTMVYYSGLHCNFVRPEELTEIGGDSDSAPVSLGPHELFFIPLSGYPTFVADLDDEWNAAPNGGPAREAAPDDTVADEPS